MTLLPLLRQAPRHASPARQRAGARPAPAAMTGPGDTAGAADNAPPRGCGWYDSSHDLQAGLRVTEHTDVAAVVNQVPLSWWLGWELDAARASAR